MSDDKSGSPPCGIYVRIDDFSDMPKLITDLRQMAMVINRASGYERNMSVVELVCTEASGNSEPIGNLIALLQAQGLVVILSGWIEENALQGADGILVDDLSVAINLRKTLGDDVIIGLKCPSRVLAEEAIHAPLDYAVLPADPVLLTWWSVKTQGLSVASGHGLTNHSCGGLVRAGAGFIDVSEYVFGYEKGVMQGTVNILHAIDLAAQMPKALN